MKAPKRKRARSDDHGPGDRGRIGVVRSEYAGVTVHWRTKSRCGVPRYQARHGAVKLGEFSSQLDAARAVAKACRTTIAKLRSAAASRPGNATRLTLRRHWFATYRIFKRYRPADVVSMETFEQRYRSDIAKVRGAGGLGEWQCSGPVDLGCT